MPPFFASDGFRSFGALVAVLSLLVPGPAEAEEIEGELRSRLRVASRELESLRSSLHDALVALAEREERIEALEAELHEARNSGNSVDAGNARPAPSPAAKPEPRPAVQSAADRFEFAYEAHTAVSYEGREAALAWLRTRIEREPGFAVRIVATANDSRYPEANQAIADNRAKFLADYLAMNGVPRDAIVSAAGRVSGPAEDPTAGRSAVLEAASRPASTESP